LIYFVRSVLNLIGPTEEFGATKLSKIASSRIIYAPIGSKNRVSGFSVHTSRTRSSACTSQPQTVHQEDRSPAATFFVRCQIDAGADATPYSLAAP